MKKVIEGLVYNTDTADEVASWSNHYYRNDFKHCQEKLYRTKNGRWFIYGEGGPMSKYAQPCADGVSGGKDIVSLTDGEAIAWLQEHNMIEVIEEYFPMAITEA